MTAWTTPGDVKAKLHRRWISGELLARLGEECPWKPLGIPIRGPTAREIASDFDKVQSWVRAWQRAGCMGRLEYRRVGGRLVGANEVPAKIWFDSYQQVWAALGTEQDAARFATLIAEAKTRTPRLTAWMVKHPVRLLELAQEWQGIVDTVLWTERHSSEKPYLRQIDVPGVDTKFIERHRKVLAQLLDHQLDERRIDDSQPRSAFTARYGFKQRPVYARFRALGPGEGLPGGFSELSVRLEELAGAPIECSSVYVVENEITYLAFPPVKNAIALLGGGYAVTILEQLSWLADRHLIYWGDIDTHGFAILDRLRQRFPHATSMLMDRATLLAHESQWAREANQRVAALECLQPSEAELYRDLVEDTLGPSVRLEQERVSYFAIERALATRSANDLHEGSRGHASSPDA